jgi:putative membrane-bound dehydrogenase-like protein
MRCLSSLTLTLALATFAQAQLPPEKALATMQPAAGFQVDLFAAEPMLFNPTSIDVDQKGRVWVAEAVNYRRTAFNRPIIRKEGDRIVVLVDEKGAGKATKAVTFYQGKDLYGPLGVCVAPYPDGKGQKVFVCQSPDILVFEDKDGDLKADGPPKKFLTGFGGFDHDHGVHGINIGPDGKLYFTVGDAGVTALQSADKKGPVFKSNTTTIQKGTVWRCDMDGNNLELIAHNFRNNYECCVDSFGEIWLSDNDDDGNQQTRICFVMPGGNYGYGPRGDGKSHWHEEDPGIVHKVLRTGFGSPTGITFYEGSLFPEKYRGALLHCDAGPREVRAFFRKPKGAGYELDKEVILTSTDTWFRPSDVCVAPDGSIFVADWYDKGVGGHAMNDPQDGRIYRLTPKGHNGYKVPEVKLDTKEGVLAALGSPCQATRWMGMDAIARTPQKQSLPYYVPFIKDSKSEDQRLRARVLWQLPHFAGREALDIAGHEVMDEENPLAIQCLGGSLVDSLLGPAGKFNATAYPKGDIPKLPPSLARQMAILLRKADVNFYTLNNFYTLAKLYDGQDIFYRAALNIACGTDPKRRDEILADFDKHFPEWNDKVADLAWELRPKSSLPRLGKLLADTKLTGPQKSRIIDILGASDDPTAARTVLAVLKSDAPAEVKAAAITQLRIFLPTKWNPLLNSNDFVAALNDLLAEPKTQATGLQLTAVARATYQADTVVKIAADENTSAETRKEAVRTLGKLPDEKSVYALMKLSAPENPLSVPCMQALGELLPKTPKPPKYATQALDWVTQLLTAPKASAELKAACVVALAGNRAGAAWIFDAHEKGLLSPEVELAAGRLLRNSPFKDVQAKAKLAFPAPGKLDPKKLPAITELAKRTGDAARGKQIWEASLAGAAQCAKCHTVRGIGGQVGPDLSMIGKKGGKENILESILLPSKAIADQYVQQSITTTADVTVSGLVNGDTPQAITLRDANGKDTVIPKADIASQKKLMISIMPEDIVAALSEDELIDLVAYLATLQTAAITPSEFKIIGPFPGKDMLDALNAKNSIETETMFKPIWMKTIRPDAKGYFDLAAFHGDKANNSASYMYAEFESPLDQDAEILLGPDDGAKLWVNDKEVFKTEETRAATPGAHKIAIKLKKGSNAILLKVANGNNPHGFYFTLLSKDEVKPTGPK